MSSYFTDVQQFHRVVCRLDRRGTAPARLDIERLTLRCQLMQEEWEELDEALWYLDVPEAAKEAADVIVTILGTMDEMGIPFDKVWEAVHESNLAKANGPQRQDGKHMKPPGWQAPDIAGILQSATSGSRNART